VTLFSMLKTGEVVPEIDTVVADLSISFGRPFAEHLEEAYPQSYPYPRGLQRDAEQRCGSR
jgi:hypothetical protein